MLWLWGIRITGQLSLELPGRHVSSIIPFGATGLFVPPLPRPTVRASRCHSDRPGMRGRKAEIYARFITLASVLLLSWAPSVLTPMKRPQNLSTLEDTGRRLVERLWTLDKDRRKVLSRYRCLSSVKDTYLSPTSVILGVVPTI